MFRQAFIKSQWVIMQNNTHGSNGGGTKVFSNFGNSNMHTIIFVVQNNFNTKNNYKEIV